MLLNANIPLNTQTPARQYLWRVGVFLGIFLLCFFLGWGSSKRLFIGMRTPLLTTPSGITLRITPEHALWLKKNTEGLALSNTCPLDIPKLVSLAHPTWMLMGDSGKEELFFTGNVPSELKNYTTTFSCNITVTPQGFFIGETTSAITHTFSFVLPDAWAWIQNATSPISLNDRGLTLTNIISSEKTVQMPWPQKDLTSALPISSNYSEVFSHQWQGISNLLSLQRGVALFSWNEEGIPAFGLVLKGELTDEDALALVYDLAQIPTATKKLNRKDGTIYTANAQENVTMTSINTTHQEARLKEGAVVGFFTKQGNYTLFSTTPTTWESMSPHWETTLNKNIHSEKHLSRTLSNFGDKIFIKKTEVNIFTN